MGLRLRKSFKIVSGLRINLSKTGVSASVGTRGASVNLSSRGTRTTVGVPGTGISYSAIDSAKQNRSLESAATETDTAGSIISSILQALFTVALVLLFLALWIFGFFG